jgi:hypothetical protein
MLPAKAPLPRSAVTLHVAALNRSEACSARPHMFVEEARVLPLELMGHLVAIYRDASLAQQIIRRNPGG